MGVPDSQAGKDSVGCFTCFLYRFYRTAGACCTRFGKKDAQVGFVDYEYKSRLYRNYQPEPDINQDRIKAAAALINKAEKPFCLVGQGVLLGGAEEELKAFLLKNDIPAGSTVLGLSALPSDFPLNKGMLGMHGNVGPNRKTNECDVLIASVCISTSCYWRFEDALP